MKTELTREQRIAAEKMAVEHTEKMMMRKAKETDGHLFVMAESMKTLGVSSDMAFVRMIPDALAPLLALLTLVENHQVRAAYLINVISTILGVTKIRELAGMDYEKEIKGNGIGAMSLDNGDASKVATGIHALSICYELLSQFIVDNLIKNNVFTPEQINNEVAANEKKQG